MLAAGADGCRSGWICVLRGESGHVTSRVFESARELMEQQPKPAALAIDVPIGLSDKGPRGCDRAARSLLGPRASSVFPAPIRALLAALSWEEACSIRERLEGKRISKQAWAIVPKIMEVDRALRDKPERHRWVREVHPEVCFWAWNGSPMSHAKKHAVGRQSRLQLVTDYFGESAFSSVRNQHPKKHVADDDILDAFAALWTAERIVRGKAKTIPEQVPTDSEGLRMEMVY